MYFCKWGGRQNTYEKTEILLFSLENSRISFLNVRKQLLFAVPDVPQRDTLLVAELKLDAFLSRFVLVGNCIKEIVSGDIIEFAKGNEMVDRHLVGTPLIACIHGLGCAENICDLLLR